MSRRGFNKVAAWLVTVLGVLLGLGAFVNTVGFVFDHEWGAALVWAALSFLFGFGVFRAVQQLRQRPASDTTHRTT